MLSWLSCRKFCECASKKLDAEVRWYQLPGYYFHYMICLTCRRYKSQIELIDKALGNEQSKQFFEQQPSLDSKARQRIATHIEENALKQ